MMFDNRWAMTLTLFAALAVPHSALAAQEVIEVTGRDRHIDTAFEEVSRVGVLNGEPWEMFGRVEDVGFDARGNLYVFDALGEGSGGTGLRVLVFDADGNFVHQFGSSGEGPGEFNRPEGYTVMRDGTTIVSDRGHSAYQIFDDSGAFVRMVRASDGPGRGSVSDAIVADPRGGAVFTGGFGATVSFSIGGSARTEPQTSRPVLRLGLAGEVIATDTVADGWLPPRGEPGETGATVEFGGRTLDLSSAFDDFAMSSIFEPRLMSGVLPDGGMVYSDSSTYALKVTAAGSRDVSRIITRPFPPEPVTPATEEAYRELQASRREARREGRGPGASGSVTSTSTSGSVTIEMPANFSLKMPERSYYHELPVLRGIFTTWEGRIWVQRLGDELESDGPIDVLTAEGDYVGTFATDATAIPDAFGPDGLAAFIELDEFDVASVVVRRLPATVR